MRIFILDTNYQAFTQSFWEANAQLGEATYDQAWRVLMDECFGTADFYSYNLAKIGIEACEFIANDFELQRLWARENDVAIPVDKMSYRLGRHKKFIPILRRSLSQKWVQTILRAQLEKFAPDVLYVQDINSTSADFLRWAAPRVRLIAGQTAYPLAVPNIALYDVIFTSFPHYVTQFEKQGLKARYLKIAFEPRVLQRLPSIPVPAYDLSFAGGLSSAHAQRMVWLEELGAQIPLDIWGYGVESLSLDSPLRARHHGPAWGLGIYRALQNSKISLNFHIDVAQNYANNMRLYEATGVGSLLLTDQKDNLPELFEVGQEVVAYENAEDAIQKIKYLLDHEAERHQIALAGQTRTLREHTYFRRMEELVEFLKEELV